MNIGKFGWKDCFLIRGWRDFSYIRICDKMVEMPASFQSVGFVDHAVLDLVVGGGNVSPAAAMTALRACDFEHSVRLLLPLGAGFILGV